MNKLKTIGIVESRMGSSRLPGKALLKIGSKESIFFLIERLKKSKQIDQIIVATTISKKDDKLVSFLKKKKIIFFRGSENNVLKRVYEAAKKFRGDIIVELSGDSPFLDNQIIDDSLIFFKKNIFLDYANIGYNYPGGLGFQIFNFKTLKKCFEGSKTQYEKEHVTPYIISNPKLFNSFYFVAPKKLSYPNIQLLLDEKKDLLFLNEVANLMYKKKNTTIENLLKSIINSKINKINATVNRTKIK